VARSDFEPFRGLPTGTFCAFVSAVSGPTLRGDNIASLGLPDGVLFSETGAFVKRLGCTAKGRCQALGGLLGSTCCLLSEALALGSRALVRGPPSAISRFLASPPLLKPSEARALRLLPVSALLTLISQAFALVRDVVTLVGGSLSLIRDPFTLIRDPVALIRDPLALRRHPPALVGHPLVRRRLSMLTTAPTLIAQPVTLALQFRIIGREPRRAAPNLRAEPLDLGPRRLTGRCDRADAQPRQIGAIRFELCRLALEGDAPPLELSPLRVAECLPHRSSCFMVCRALLMHERRLNVYRSPVRTTANSRFHSHVLFNLLGSP
jgi:hypothetical protein